MIQNTTTGVFKSTPVVRQPTTIVLFWVMPKKPDQPKPHRLGLRIKTVRDELGWTQDDLVALVKGATQASLSALETRNSITTTLLFGYATALKVRPEWLLTGEEPRDIDQLEAHVLETYQQLSPAGKNAVLSNINRLLAKEKSAVPEVDLHAT